MALPARISGRLRAARRPGLAARLAGRRAGFEAAIGARAARPRRGAIGAAARRWQVRALRSVPRPLAMPLQRLVHRAPWPPAPTPPAGLAHPPTGAATAIPRAMAGVRRLGAPPPTPLARAGGRSAAPPLRAAASRVSAAPMPTPTPAPARRFAPVHPASGVRAPATRPPVPAPAQPFAPVQPASGVPALTPPARQGSLSPERVVERPGARREDGTSPAGDAIPARPSPAGDALPAGPLPARRLAARPRPAARRVRSVSPVAALRRHLRRPQPRQLGPAGRRGAPVIRIDPSIGTPLPPALRAAMERRLGRGLASVRVHTDEAAGRAAGALDAAAFTVGHHIFFAPGRFRPTDPGGRALIAHELVHVAQQPAGRPFAEGELAPPDRMALEARARSVAGAPHPLTAGVPRPVLLPPALSPTVARAAPLLQTEGEAAATPEPAPEPAESARAELPPVDVRRLSEDVQRMIERRLRLERERVGVQRWA